MWCGKDEFPMAAQSVAAWQQDKDVQAHLLVADGILLGYGELWFDAEENEVELARIIIAPDVRGQGHGRTLVLGLLQKAAEAGYPGAILRVHPHNIAALRCYQGAGFVPVDPELAKEWNAPQPVDYVWLHQDVSPGAPPMVTS
jgi:[ribosomal protein S18]-alanine N-acetyltransferase